MGRRAYSIAIELTAHCNQKCTYCYNSWREDDGKSVGAPEKEVLLARVTRLVDALCPDHVTLTGGEPFANNDVWEVMDVLRDRKIRMQIISNGGLVTDKVAARLAPYRPSYVQVTFDGPNAELHEEHTGRGKGHFEKTIAGIKAMQGAGVRVGGCIVMTRKNARVTGEILALFTSLGIDQIALSRFSPAGYAARHVAELLPSVAEAHIALEQCLVYAKNGMHVVCTMPMPPCAIEVERFAPIEFGACAIGTEMQEIALGPDGRLRNCTLHGSSILEGDVLDIDLSALLDAPNVRDYKSTVPEFCRGCLHEKTCGGGCGAAAQWVLGDRSMPDPFVWQHIDDAFAARLEALRTPEHKEKRRLEIVP